MALHGKRPRVKVSRTAEIVKHDREDSGSVPRCSAVVDIGLIVVVAQATDAAHAAVFRRHRPDITLMDFRLSDGLPVRKTPGNTIHLLHHSGQRWVQPWPPYLGS
jgi:hypothetical protein